MEESKLTNKQRRKLFTNKDKWERRRNSNKAKRRAFKLATQKTPNDNR